MTTTPQVRVAARGSVTAAGPPTPRMAAAAARPGAPPASPVVGAGAPGSPDVPGSSNPPGGARGPLPAQPCTGAAPGRRSGICGDSEAAHDIRQRDGARTACSVLLGPRGTRCGCKRYEAGEPR